MIATGAKNAQIADRFVISQNTVKSHVSRILQKLPAANRTEAAFRYIELYGAPSPSAAAGGGTERGDRITAASAVKATVAALPGGDELVLTLQDGRDLEVPLLERDPCRRARRGLSDRLLRSAGSRDGLVPARRGDRRRPAALGAVGAWLLDQPAPHPLRDRRRPL